MKWVGYLAVYNLTPFTNDNGVRFEVGSKKLRRALFLW